METEFNGIKATYKLKATTILMGQTVGMADTPHGKLEIVASGKTMRISLRGHTDHVDVDMQDIADRAYEILTRDK